MASAGDITGQTPIAKVLVAAADTKNVKAICIALFLITLAVFGRTVTFEFLRLDDNDYVYANPRTVQGLTFENVVHAFSHGDCLLYHPLTMLSHELDCQIFGLNPAGHHLANVLLHAATAVLLFLVLRNMTGALWRSAIVAAVFAVHPLRVESVAWVTERKDVLSGLFFVLTIGAYARYALRPSPFRYGLVLLLFVCGLLSKPMLVTLPLVLLLLDYWPLNRWPKGFTRLAIEKLPLLVLSAASCVATILAAKNAVAVGATFPFLTRAANAVVSCVVYLKQMLWPANLVVMYPFPRHGVPWWDLALAAVVLAAISAAAWAQRRTRPWFLAGWLWYLVMLLPVLGIVQAGYHAHADRFTYLPQIGIYIAITWLVAEWNLSKAAVGGMMAGVLAVLMVCSWNQSGYWQNSYSLFTHALACTRDNDVMDDDMGVMLMDAGRLDDAVFHFRSALKANPRSSEAHCNLGLVLSRQGKNDEAMAQYAEAIRIDSNMAEANSNLGMMLAARGRPDEAAMRYRKALQSDPDNGAILNNLGWLLATTTNASVRDGKSALRLSLRANELTGGENLIILHTLGAAYAEAGHFPKAIETAGHALALAQEQGNGTFAGQLQYELKFYQAGKPYHAATDAIGPHKQ